MSDHADRLARMCCVGFDGVACTPELIELLERGVCSVILFARNYESPPQLADLCWQIKAHGARLGHPILICVDQEGGRVQRFGAPLTPIPSMRELGQRGDINDVRRIGRILARELRAMNIDMNLAPVMDVDSNPDNPVIGARAFGSDPNLVATFGCALIDAMQGVDDIGGIAACAKHFPGHGDTSVDSHFALPRLAHDRQRLNRVELPPFCAAAKQGVAAIMCAHVMFESIDHRVPATMSHAVVQDLLRTEIGFQRAVLSDDLEMKAIIDHFGVDEAVVRGANAGIDLFLICKEHDLQHRAIDALQNAFRGGGIPFRHIELANRRLDELFTRYVQPGSRWSERSIDALSSTKHFAHTQDP